MTDLFSAPSPTTSGPQAPPPSRSSLRQSKKVSAAARRRRRRRRIIVLLLALVVVGGAGWFVYEHVLPSFSLGGLGGGAGTKDYPGPGSGSVEVRVQPGDTGSAIGTTLHDAGVVESVGAFAKAYAANPSASGIQPGVYTLRKEMKSSDAVQMLAANTGRIDLTVTIPEGYTEDQILSRTSVVTGISEADLKSAMKDTKAMGLPAVAKGNYEGWLYPATYSFDPGVTAKDAISAMVAKTTSELEHLGVPAKDQEDTLIEASLVQSEAKRDADRPKIARAIDNRMARQMVLQIDSTTAYGLGTPGVAPTVAQNNDPKNAYSTYEHLGLPPGPISSPGAPSVAAVMHPADGDWLFWETVNPETGETKFAATNAQHEANKKERAAWDAAHPGK
jgi:UPF0755 protein